MLEAKGALTLDVFPEDAATPLINKYLEIKVPEVPEEIFSLLDKLERYKNVRFRMENSLLELRNDLSNHFKATSWAKEAEDELKPIEEQLSKMVCPMCGRSGIHEH